MVTLPPHPSNTVPLVGAIDLRRGIAVHAQGGRRAHYAPVAIAEGDPEGLARHYLSRGVRAFYVADLDSLEGGQPQLQVLDRLSRLSVPLWIDAGLTDTWSAKRLWDGLPPAAHANCMLLAATETLHSLRDLSEMVEQLGPDRVGASLDVRDGHVVSPTAALRGSEPEPAAKLIAAAGVSRCLIMDLGLFGSGAGAQTTSLCAAIRQAAPSLRLASGGGVRHADDVADLAAAGCDAVLVATALIANELSG